MTFGGLQTMVRRFYLTDGFEPGEGIVFDISDFPKEGPDSIPLESLVAVKLQFLRLKPKLPYLCLLMFSHPDPTWHNVSAIYLDLGTRSACG